MLKLQKSKTAVVKGEMGKEETALKKNVDILAKGVNEEVQILNKEQVVQDQGGGAEDNNFIC